MLLSLAQKLLIQFMTGEIGESPFALIWLLFSMRPIHHRHQSIPNNMFSTPQTCPSVLPVHHQTFKIWSSETVRILLRDVNSFPACKVLTSFNSFISTTPLMKSYIWPSSLRRSSKVIALLLTSRSDVLLKAWSQSLGLWSTGRNLAQIGSNNYYSVSASI